MGYLSVPSCGGCAYFHSDPGESMDGVCSHSSQSVVGVFAEDYCSLHSVRHDQRKCVICRDGDGACNNAKESLA